jgi:hypothetical protein
VSNKLNYYKQLSVKKKRTRIKFYYTIDADVDVDTIDLPVFMLLILLLYYDVDLKVRIQCWFLVYSFVNIQMFRVGELGCYACMYIHAYAHTY